MKSLSFKKVICVSVTALFVFNFSASAQWLRNTSTPAFTYLQNAGDLLAIGSTNRPTMGKLQLNCGTTNSTGLALYGGSGSEMRFYLTASGSDFNFHIAPKGVDANGITITPAGNVIIGKSTTNNYKLCVNGTIATKEVRVTNQNWSDFVFDKNYNLKPLSEVDKFIKENKHLENIPTQAQVQAEGIPVGEMQAKLLQKIEELTLYTVDLSKKIDQLTTANENLNKKANSK
jgi:hypothetical protein